MSEHAFLDDLPAYALGGLTPLERARLEEHLAAGCEICELELPAWNAAAERLPLGVTPIDPPAELKARLMARIAAERPSRPPAAGVAPAVPAVPSVNVTPLRRPEARPSYVPLALAAALVMGVGLAGLWRAARSEVSSLRAERQEIARERTALVAEVARLKSETARLETDLASKAKDIAWLHDPRVQIALLKGLKDSPQARARMLWNPGSKQGVLLVDGLPPLPLEKSYQLWVFAKDVPLPAGTFGTGADGRGVVDLAALESLGGDPSKFAVSVEPKGGVPKPTGAIVLLGERL